MYYYVTYENLFLTSDRNQYLAMFIIYLFKKKELNKKKSKSVSNMKFKKVMNTLFKDCIYAYINTRTCEFVYEDDSPYSSKRIYIYIDRLIAR